jgi:predicted nucleotidyltransferase
MTRDETARAIRSLLASQHGVSLALLFGSVARDAANEQSDIDLAVDGEDVDLARISAALSLGLGRETQVVALRDAGVPLLEEILRDGIVVYEHRPYAAARWRSHVLSDMEIDRPWYARMRDAWLRRVAQRGLDDGQP